MQPRAKAATIAALKQAEADSLAEQKIYRTIIDAAFAIPATEKHEKLLTGLGEDGLETLMEGECFPPAGEDWKQIKGYEWDQIPRRRQLEQVEDRDIFFWLYMLGEVTDHTKRLKAMAKFFGYFGAVSKDIYNTFICWQAISTLKIVLEK
jgi:hypothetical protein